MLRTRLLPGCDSSQFFAHAIVLPIYLHFVLQFYSSLLMLTYSIEIDTFIESPLILKLFVNFETKVLIKIKLNEVQVINYFQGKDFFSEIEGSFSMLSDCPESYFCYVFTM